MEHAVITVIGNLGGDAELRYTPQGTAVLGFNVASNRKRDGEERVRWFRVSLWGKQAEKMGQYLTKGTLVAVTGDFDAREFTDKQGTTRTSLDINTLKVTLMPRTTGEVNGTTEAPPEEANTDDDVPF